MNAVIKAAEGKPRVVRDKAFAQRFATSCDQHPHVPAYHYGRLTWIAKELSERFNVDVSVETVRKWSAGESIPRREKMRALAELLQVDESWLAFGTAPVLTPKKRKEQAAALGGAASLVCGCIQIDGGTIAFPREDDARGEIVHLYAIIKGAQYAIHVSLAREVGKGAYEFDVPVEHETCAVIGVVPLGGLKFDFIELKPELIEAHKETKGGYYTVPVKQRPTGYGTNRDAWPLITSFAERI